MRVESSIYEIKGKELILRNPEESDAERLLSYLKITSRETPYLIREPEEITLTLEEEKEFIKGQSWPLLCIRNTQGWASEGS